MKNINLFTMPMLFLLGFFQHNAYSQSIIEQKSFSFSEKIIKVLQDESSGQVIWTYFNENTKEGGFYLEEKEKVRLNSPERVIDFKYNSILTYIESTKLGGNTIFKLYKLNENQCIEQATFSSKGDCSIAHILNENRILVEVVWEGGLTSSLDLYDFNWELVRRINPFQSKALIEHSDLLKIPGNYFYYFCCADRTFNEDPILSKVLKIETISGQIADSAETVCDLYRPYSLNNCGSLIILTSIDEDMAFDSNLRFKWETPDHGGTNGFIDVPCENLLLTSNQTEFIYIRKEDGTIFNVIKKSDLTNYEVGFYTFLPDYANRKIIIIFHNETSLPLSESVFDSEIVFLNFKSNKSIKFHFSANPSLLLLHKNENNQYEIITDKEKITLDANH